MPLAPAALTCFHCSIPDDIGIAHSNACEISWAATSTTGRAKFNQANMRLLYIDTWSNCTSADMTLGAGT